MGVPPRAPWLKSVPLSLKCSHLTPSAGGSPFITHPPACLADVLGCDHGAAGPVIPLKAIDLHVNS